MKLLYKNRNSETLIQLNGFYFFLIYFNKKERAQIKSVMKAKFLDSKFAFWQTRKWWTVWSNT